MKRLVLISGLVMLLTGCARASGPDDVAARVASRVMSPFCPGVTLHDCPSAQADELRLEIEDWAAAGMDEGTILARLEAEYGAAVRATPPASGAGLLAWVLPALAVLGGGGTAWWLARRWTARTSEDLERPEALASTDELVRIDRELKELREG